jgi:hydroxypyruvate isomerase
MMYQEHAFLDRFAAAAQDGFRAVEYLFPYDVAASEIRARLEACGLVQVLFNAPPGDWNAGERGTACLPGREQEYRSGVLQACEYATVLGNKLVHVMAGRLPAGADPVLHRATYLQNLAWAGERAKAHGLTILIEPINTRDMPGYFLNRQQDAHAICREIGASNLQVQCDLYHCQIMEGDLATLLRRDIAGIGHVQIAGVPDRHEPDLGEVHYPYLFELLDSLGYAGWIGCEYRPKGPTSAGLAWLKPWLL